MHKEYESEMDRLRKHGVGERDHEIRQHYEDLDRYQLLSTEWKLAPIDTPDFNLVLPLIKDML
jgi:hypothetical protein